MTPNLARSGAFERFTLLDVGASRGIDEIWGVFGETLSAYAFDPLVAEMARLSAASPPGSKVKYFDAFIVRGSDVEDDRSYDLAVFLPRTSAIRAHEVAGSAYVRERYNMGVDLQYSQNRYSIDEFVARENIKSVDFIKTDTDGFDYSVLLGSENTLRNCGVLGLAVEVFFDLPPHEEANLFSNVDRYLRSLGFKLFDIDVRRYSKDALPLKFRHGIPGQTIRGQVVWADVIYLRDLLSPESRDKIAPSPQDIFKMIALFELFGLNDCAVELINLFSETIRHKFDVEQLRSVLLEEACGVADYAAYIRQFEAFMKERRFAAFPDDWEIVEEGFLLRNTRNPREHTFRRV